MIVAAIHPAAGDRADFVIGKFGRCKAVTLGAEPGEFFVLIGRHEITGDGPVARNRDRALLGEHPVMAEVAGEFGGGDDVDRLRLDHEGFPSKA